MRVNPRNVNSLSFANIQCISRLSLERYAYPVDSVLPERRRASVPPFPDEIFSPILEPRFATIPERMCLSLPWIHSAIPNTNFAFRVRTCSLQGFLANRDFCRPDALTGRCFNTLLEISQSRIRIAEAREAHAQSIHER